MKRYPCVYMRGGTSKAVYFQEKDLPADKGKWPELFLKVMGTPDKKQIDGIGGAHPTTSKIAVISPSAHKDCDVDYTFFQVGVDSAVVESHANCGNISCGVGPFAIDEGLVPTTEPVTVVKIYNTNTKKVIEEHVQVENGKSMTIGDTAVTGVPGTGSGIDVYFQNPGGASTGKLFPTGNKRDILRPKHYPPVEVTMIDCSNPVVFIRAADLGLDGSEIKELTTNQSLLEHVEAIRGCAAAAFGFADDPKDAAKLSLSVPKVSIISSPRDYVGSHGTTVKAAEMNICSRVISVGSFHKTHPITVGIATASTASIPGTIVSDLAKALAENDTFYIGHPYGIMPIKLEMDGEHVVKGGTVRIARRIMDGYIYIND